MFETFLRDCRYAIRVMFANPGSTLIAILTLALGIGANTAIFSIVNAVALKPLRYKDPDRLVFVHDTNANQQFFHMTPGNLSDVIDRTRTLDLAGARFSSAPMTGQGTPDQVDTAVITPGLLPLLGVEPSPGRAFTAQEGLSGANPTVILSHSLWQSKFGGDPNILSRKIIVNGEPRDIIGVLPQDFRLLDSKASVWLPFVMTAKNRQDRGVHDVRVIGRLRPGASQEQAAADLAAIAQQLEREHPQANQGWTTRVKPLVEHMIGDVRSGLLTLMGAVLFVLLIACANVANMLLARSNARQKEMALRAALGASPWTIVRQLLSESLLLSLAGGSLGLAMAWLGLKWLAIAAPANLPRIGEVSIDGEVLLFTFAAAIITGLLFGLAPALAARRSDLNTVLRAAGRTGMSNTSRTWVRKSLVIAEVAMSLVLLTGAGLLIRSFVELGKVDPGFRPEGAFTFKVSLSAKRYDGPAMQAFYQRLIDQLEALPGVQAAGLTRDAPLSPVHPSLNFTIENRPPVNASAEPRARFRFASDGYFPAIGMNLVKGRFFAASDSADSQPVAVINEALAALYFPGEDPIGKRVKSAFDDSPWSTIVGIAGNTQFQGLDTKPGPEIFYHYQQLPKSMITFLAATSTLVLRTAGDPANLALPSRRAVAAMDPELAIAEVRSMTEALDQSVAQPRFRLMLMSIFGITAIVLAALGLYGLLAYSVGQRINEIGVRMALGAQPSSILKMVVGEGLQLALIGAAVGAGLSFWLARFLEKLLFGIQTRDVSTFVAAPILILIVAVLASVWPARNATRVDPVDALRAD